MSESAWKWGPYRKGMGADDDDRRIIYAVKAIKKELVYVGAEGADKMNMNTSLFGGAVNRAVKAFQETNGLVADGKVGPATANALWRSRIGFMQRKRLMPRNWLRAQVRWESADDPGAQFVNPDGSVDRGLCQLNSVHKPLTDDEAFDPETALRFLAEHLERNAAEFADCDVDQWRLAVGSWRTPVGAQEWCEDPTLMPDQDGTWGQKAAFYVERVDTIGRLGWVG